ncbi:MAG: YkgJ family cysteine cluster protein [Bacteroidales bacterium]|nr:YkgJ family cysteine cluster protein [Bacteroidales bacterium]
MTRQESHFFECRKGCGACCIAPSISSPIPGLPNGKSGGFPCPHLTDDGLCAIFLSPDRPKVCDGFRADTLVCGSCRREALKILGDLEGLDGDALADKYGDAYGEEGT